MVQEEILLKLSSGHGNMIVAGDDAQSIYGFRGARARNIIEFAQRVPNCSVVNLFNNYRSHEKIVSAYNRLLAPTGRGDPAERSITNCKTISARAWEARADYPAVISVRGKDPQDEGRQLADLIHFLKKSRFIADFSQVALLLHSVQSRHSDPYLAALRSAGISVQCVPSRRRLNTVGSHAVAETMAMPAGISRPGQVLVTTIHQAKGLEWPVVIVGSLHFGGYPTTPMEKMLRRYRRRPESDSPWRVSQMELLRQFYVAFSRPQRLLVLTGSREPRPHFTPVLADAPQWPEVDLDSLRRHPYPVQNPSLFMYRDELTQEISRLGLLTIRIRTSGN